MKKNCLKSLVGICRRDFPPSEKSGGWGVGGGGWWMGGGGWGVIWSCPLNRFQNMKNIQIFFSFRVFSTKCVLIQIFVKQKNYKSKGKKYSAIPVLKYNVITLVKIHDSVFDTRKKYDI